MIHKNCTNAAFAPRLIVLAGAVMSASASFGHFVANAYSRSGRVEDGRGSLGHAATLRFPSPLIEPDVRISRIRLVWGFLCQGCITPFLSHVVTPLFLFDPSREHSSIPTAHCRRRRAQQRSKTALL